MYRESLAHIKKYKKQKVQIKAHIHGGYTCSVTYSSTCVTTATRVTPNTIHVTKNQGCTLLYMEF